MKYIIYYFKKLFCILTINENICILPYKEVKNKVLINTITKIISKNANNVVLSNYLNSLNQLKILLNKNDVYIYNGELLKKYLIYYYIDYISKIRKEEIHSQEIFILSNSPKGIDENIIRYFAENFKRINIVTQNINRFKRLEMLLEKNLGIAMTITSNRRKSLLKSKIIVNLDFDEDLLASFNINPNAIIIQTSNVRIKSKLFNGINILDSQIIFDSSLYGFDKQYFRKFNNKFLYESTINNLNFEDIINKIREDNVKIVNLIGRNGVINIQEFDNKFSKNY